jgi:hypothetical protein
MRRQTPIHEQRTTQTQLSRGRPHNPSLVRRNQSPRQRQSVMRQMQQQTRQRTRRQRPGTPLPEKPRRKRQTTHRRHANTIHRHMVNHTPPPFQTRRRKADGEERHGAERRGEEDGRDNKRNTMVFGDNVRARRAARALPRTPTIRERRERRERREQRRQDRQQESHTPPFHNDTPLSQRHHTNQQCCDSKHKGGREKKRSKPQAHTTALPLHRNIQHKGKQNNARRTGQRTAPTPKTRDTTAHTTPAIQHGHHTNQKGDANT